MKIRKLDRDDYKKITLLGLLLFGLKSVAAESLPVGILLLSDLIGVVIIVSGVMWAIMARRERKEVKK